ncbi:hypothetical protein [Limosilactobacillus reuteri]|uniref:Uncharacterized protein n=1 Tax=Limosilactobacillus reuteri TaxID=1598 RepID=A0A256STY9_LIMRT|nr:hypothetical protein [Limosilactobacillus reuteri]OYS70327.1 hypothetical protein CBF96_02590 [Limosilactobacillus reuteri]
MGTLIIFRDGHELMVREKTREIVNQGLYADKVIVTRRKVSSIDKFEIEWNSMKKLIAIDGSGDEQ